MEVILANEDESSLAISYPSPDNCATRRAASGRPDYCTVVESVNKADAHSEACKELSYVRYVAKLVTAATVSA